MTVRRCPDCHQHIEWMLTKFGKRLPFGHKPIPIEADAEEAGWIPGEWPIGRHRRTALAPITHYGRTRRERVRHVVLVHRCPEYLSRINSVMAGGNA